MKPIFSKALHLELARFYFPHLLAHSGRIVTQRQDDLSSLLTLMLSSPALLLKKGQTHGMALHLQKGFPSQSSVTRGHSNQHQPTQKEVR